jgi:hypothetical protein
MPSANKLKLFGCLLNPSHEKQNDKDSSTRGHGRRAGKRGRKNRDHLGHVGVRTIKQERMVTLLSKRSAVVKTKLL